MMIALGAYVFSVGTAAYGSLRRSVEYGWKSTPRVGKRPMQEFISRGDERIELSGVIYPDYRGGIAQVDVLHMQAGLGKPLPLVGGDGRVFGLWVGRRDSLPWRPELRAGVKLRPDGFRPGLAGEWIRHRRQAPPRHGDTDAHSRRAGGLKNRKYSARPRRFVLFGGLQGQERWACRQAAAP